MGRGRYGTYVGEERWWRRRAPTAWQRSRVEWERLPEWQQQRWWQYQQQQPAYYPGWRWVPGYGGVAGHWAREGW